MSRILWVLLLAAASYGVEIPFNLGLGPTLHYLPGPLEEDGPFYSGFTTDLYAAITRELLQQNLDKVPRKLRRHVKSTHEIGYKPGILGWLPSQFVVHPKSRGTAVYGGTLSLVSLGTVLGDGRTFIPRVALKLPTATYLFMDSDLLREDKHFLGLGGSASAEAKLAFSRQVHLSLRWDSHFYAPLQSTRLVPVEGSRENQWHHGALSLLLHYRVMVDRKL